MIDDEIKELLTPYDCDLTKTRIGNNGDGGYVVIKELLEKSPIVYSAGVLSLQAASADFDAATKYGNKIIKMFDIIPLQKNPNFLAGLLPNMKFYNESVNLLSLTSRLEKEEHNDLTLLMDIEGGEYFTLTDMNDALLNKFNQICIEVHWISDTQKGKEKSCKKEAHKLFKKLNNQFKLIHIHGNNHSPLSKSGMPDVIELTYINKNTKTKFEKSKTSCPSHLDFPNKRSREDYILDWWL